MTVNELKSMLNEAAERGATMAINRLRDKGKIRYYLSNSFRKTEDLLYLYPKLPDDNKKKQKINEALSKIENDEYYGVIASRYFDCMTISAISEIYDCKPQNISRHRNKLIRILASELFPEDVLKEILEK